MKLEMRAYSAGGRFGAVKPGMFPGLSRPEGLCVSPDLGLEMWAGDISLQLVCQGSCSIKVSALLCKPILGDYF